MAEDLLAFSADGPWQSWQMAEDLLAFSADGPWQSWQMAEDLLAFSADGPGFLGKWPKRATSPKEGQKDYLPERRKKSKH